MVSCSRRCGAINLFCSLQHVGPLQQVLPECLVKSVKMVVLPDLHSFGSNVEECYPFLNVFMTHSRKPCPWTLRSCVPACHFNFVDFLQERCSLQQCHVQNFVTGRAQPEEVAAEASDVPLLQSVQTFLTDNGQVTLYSPEFCVEG